LRVDEPHAPCTQPAARRGRYRERGTWTRLLLCRLERRHGLLALADAREELRLGEQRLAHLAVALVHLRVRDPGETHLPAPAPQIPSRLPAVRQQQPHVRRTSSHPIHTATRATWSPLPTATAAARATWGSRGASGAGRQRGRRRGAARRDAPLVALLELRVVLGAHGGQLVILQHPPKLLAVLHVQVRARCVPVPCAPTPTPRPVCSHRQCMRLLVRAHAIEHTRLACTPPL